MNPILFIKAFAFSLVLFVFSAETFAQCKEGEFSQVINYDTTIYGWGNDTYNLTFPQLNPNVGTLVGVNVSTELTLKYSFQLENHNMGSQAYRVRVTRDDVLVFPGGSDGKPPVTQIYGPYVLQGSNGQIASGADYIEVGPLFPFNHFVTNYNLTGGLAGSRGTGTAAIEYSTNSLVNATGSLNNTLQGQAIDTIHFRISYLVCKTSFLPADILRFNASRKSSGDIALTWDAPNDEAGNRYMLEKSNDGRKYSAFETVVSKSSKNNSYQVKYEIRDEDNKKLFFRIRTIGADNEVKYSQIKIVGIPDRNAGSIKIYPTVNSGNFNISFQEGSKEDWSIALYNISGTLVQSGNYNQTNLIRYSAKTRLVPGTYVVRALNTKTKVIQNSKIIVQ